MINTPDLIVQLRKLYLQNSGTISVDDLLPIIDANQLQLADIEELLTSLIADLPSKKNVALPYKEVNRFLLLQKAIESKESSAVYQAVSPHLQLLKENFRTSSPDCALSIEAAQKISVDSLPYAEKLPKLVKALTDYASLCEKHFSSTTSLKRLRINIRLFPLAEEANQLVEKNTEQFTTDDYWSIAETLYKSSLPLFKDNPSNFSVVRAFLDEAIINNKIVFSEIVLPTALSFPTSLPEEKAKEPEVIIEESAELVVAKLNEPAVEPKEPIIEPEETTIEPEVTIVENETPTIEPEEPIIEPEETTIEPEVTIVENETPTIEPKEPIIEPEETTIEPEVTIVENETPTVEPKEPIIEPEETTVEPEEAIVENKTPTIEPKVPTIEPEEPNRQQPEVAADKQTPKVEKSRGKKGINAIALIMLVLLSGAIGFYLAQKETEIVPAPIQQNENRQEDTISPTAETETAPLEATPSTPSQNKEIKQEAKREVKQEIKQEKKQEKKEPGEAVPTPNQQQPKAEDKPETTVSLNSFDALLKKAKEGNATAQYQVAQCYENGTHVQADLFEAITWYRKAKVNGSKPAEQRLMELGY